MGGAFGSAEAEVDSEEQAPYTFLTGIEREPLLRVPGKVAESDSLRIADDTARTSLFRFTRPVWTATCSILTGLLYIYRLNPVRVSPQTLSVLGALRKARGGWTYGYDLSRATGIKSGTLYPILARLHDEGWLETKWTEPQEPGRPPRHLYRLTAIGSKEASRVLSSAVVAKYSTQLALEN